VVRASTERPEALGTFCHLAAPGPELVQTANAILADIRGIHASLARLPSPYGAGDATRLCVEGVEKWLSDNAITHGKPRHPTGVRTITPTV
jgi:UDP-N-acetylglucosamine 2-epimerase (non-hydrolysing)